MADDVLVHGPVESERAYSLEALGIVYTLVIILVTDITPDEAGDAMLPLVPHG